MILRSFLICFYWLNDYSPGKFCLVLISEPIRAFEFKIEEHFASVKMARNIKSVSKHSRAYKIVEASRKTVTFQAEIGASEESSAVNLSGFGIAR